MNTKFVFTKVLQFLILGIFICTPLFAQSWIEQKSGTMNPLASIYFYSPLAGVTVGEAGTILYTIDAYNWFPTKQVTKENLYDVAFLNEKIGIIVGDNGTILISRNGGSIWKKIKSPTVNDLRTVCFGIDGRIYIGGKGIILYSDNDAISWNISVISKLTFTGSSVPKDVLNEVWFSAEDGVIIQSVDGGVTFTEKPTYVNSNINNIFMLGDGMGYASGKDHTLLFTNSNGKEWLIKKGIYQEINSIYFTNYETGWIVCEYGEIYYTRDGGFNWEKENCDVTVAMKDVFFWDQDNAWAVADKGIIVRRYTLQDSKLTGNINEKSSLSQNFPNPFNPSTNINFNIAKSGFVSLKVYDIAGKEVANLVNENLNSGLHNINWVTTGLPSGIYIYTLKTDNYTETKKMTLVK